jgi:hypothetical protein
VRPTTEASPVVRVARAAAERIRRRGGRLYLWQTAVGGAWLLDRMAFERPSEVWDFECTESEAVELCVSAGTAVHEIRVEPSRWPFGGVRVYVDGKRWGWRGPAA